MSLPYEHWSTFHLKKKIGSWKGEVEIATSKIKKKKSFGVPLHCQDFHNFSNPECSRWKMSSYSGMQSHFPLLSSKLRPVTRMTNTGTVIIGAVQTMWPPRKRTLPESLSTLSDAISTVSCSWTAWNNTSTLVRFTAAVYCLQHSCKTNKAYPFNTDKDES